MDFTTTTALISGANRGLGKQFAAQLLERGARVYAGARHPETIDTSTGLIPVELDITDHDSIAAAARATSGVNLLINNAGISTGSSLLTGEFDTIRADFDTNFYGTLAMIRAFAGPIEDNGGGAILNVLSVLSWFALPGGGAYSAAKAASWSMTNAVRQELAPKGIRVTGLHVGYMDTDMADHIDGPKSDAAHVAKTALDAVAAGEYEILADDLSHQVRAGLAGGVAALYPELP
ncbi:SDR family oxidoreductase [Nocardia sp. NPDC049190]|uniref:SDR family oxidoreductase n=1 Tax=Nocardia sp. NPDC049190 TaxID=3155650 RepID=UPI0033C54639